MTAHEEEEAAVRGHGPRPTDCDHEGTSGQLGSGCTRWCNRCGALSVSDDHWTIPSMRVPDSVAIRDRDTMHETLTIVQDRSTKQAEEIRLLKARLARYGG